MNVLKEIRNRFFRKMAEVSIEEDNKEIANFPILRSRKEIWLFFIYKLLLLLIVLLAVSLISKNPIFIATGLFIVSIITTAKLFLMLDDSRKGFAFGGFTIYLISNFKLLNEPETGILAIAKKISSIANSFLVAFNLPSDYAIYISSFIWLYFLFLIMLGIQDLTKKS
jgi:hypothetical protein